MQFSNLDLKVHITQFVYLVYAIIINVTFFSVEIVTNMIQKQAKCNLFVELMDFQKSYILDKW